MRICLLMCSAPFLIDEKVFPPLGLMAVGTALRQQGHDVQIAEEPDNSTYFAVGPTTPQYFDAREKLRTIKSQRPDCKVIIGGPHAAANIEECLDDGFDVVAIGDGENVSIDIFNGPNIVDLGRNDLDSYPIIDRSLVDIHSYRYDIAGQLATTVLTTRGCPYRCGFCAKTEDRVRYRSVDHVAKEVRYLKETWGYRALMFFDDTFILNKKRAMAICEVLEQHGIAWRAFIRGDLIVRHGKELVECMARCGCVEVGIGIESGSDLILNNINKGEDIATIRSAILMLREGGIRVKGFFIVGLPGESIDTLGDTRQFIEEVALDAADFTIYQPYRGSPIWNNKCDYDVSWEQPDDNSRFYKGRCGEYKCGVHTSQLTAENLVAARDQLENQFNQLSSQRGAK